MNTVLCYWLSSGESHALCCEGLGGLSISSALSHSTSVVSRTSGLAEQHSIHGYSILKMTLLRGEKGGNKTGVKEKKVALQMKREWEEKRSTGGVTVGNEGNWVNIATCLRNTAAVLNLALSGKPLSGPLNERGKGAEKKKKWFEELISLLCTSRDGIPRSLSVSRSNFTQEKCLRITSLNLEERK